MTHEDIMVRGDSGHFEEADVEELTEELVFERFGYTADEIQDMIDKHEREANGGFFGGLLNR